jgi:hypothetical protein
MSPRHELPHDAAAEDSRRTRDEDAHPAGMTIKRLNIAALMARRSGTRAGRWSIST